MTESSVLATHPAQNQYPVTAAPSLASPLPNGSLSDTNAQEEEEYTIKCICVYQDDDGNTVYCPKCDTWQHIECYYHGKRVPDEHFCNDCFPRDLDAKKATERQRRHREAPLDSGDRKAKRSAQKNPKKKHKDTPIISEHVNGWHSHERHESRDGPPAKKPKTNHRTSGSIVSMNGDSRKRAASTAQSYPSPSKSPQDMFRFPAVPAYTPEFLELYDRDQGNIDADASEHTIQATNILSAWRTKPSLIVNENEQQPVKERPFVRPSAPLDSSKWPEVTIETVQKTDIEIDGRHPTWRLLRVHRPVKKDEVVGEIRGQISVLEEHCQQKSSSNRWQELRHPDPFVFFHPHMDLCIDSRKSGTLFRYIRRSCMPNVTLKTFITDDDQAHHCFVATKDIPAGSELTTTWYLDTVMQVPADDASRQDPQAHNRRVDWASRVLANFGDCACDAGPACHLVKVDGRAPAKPLDAITKDKGTKKKRPRVKHGHSPLGTGHATNSRAGSEPKIHEDEETFDRRSTTDSSRSGPQSRDITPVNVAALDADPVLGTGLTGRELRKIQMAEKAFAQREQEKKEQHAPGQQRKKKRTSGGSTLNTPNVLVSKQPGQQPNSNPSTPNVLRQNNTFSASPPPSKGTAKPMQGQVLGGSKSQNLPVRPVYVSVSVQTDPEESEVMVPAAKRRKFCTPTQRLLKRLFEDRVKHTQQATGSLSPTAALPEVRPGLEPRNREVEMADAPPAGNHVSAPTLEASGLSIPGSSPVNVGTSTYPLPSQAAHTVKPYKDTGATRVQTSSLPPVPPFNMTSFSSPAATWGGGSTGTPSTSSTGPPSLSLQSLTNIPLSLGQGAITPGPARKKLSLGDYMSRRNLASTPSTEKSQALGGLAGVDADGAREGEHVRSPSGAADSSPLTSRPSEELVQQVAAQGGLGGSAVDDRPSKDEGFETEQSPFGAGGGGLPKAESPAVKPEESSGAQVK